MTKTATGYISFDVSTTCPHCGTVLNLTQFPYSHGQFDSLIFSQRVTNDWDNLAIDCPCCYCKKSFTLTALELRP